MKIAIDLDGCVYDYVAALRGHFAAHGVEFMPDPDRYEIWDCWNIDKERYLQIVRQAEFEGLFHQGQPYPGAIEALQQLKKAGHSIHIITHRMNPHAQTSTVGWLASNDVPCDTLTFTEDKSGYPVDICIEDNIENANAIVAGGVPCVLMDRPWNAQFEWKPRVSTWPQFVEEVRKTTIIESARVVAGEVRQTSPTGGQKGQKPEQYSLIPVEPLAEVARVYAHGAEKYSRDNYLLGYDYSLSYDALQRHVNAFWSGETCDRDSGLHHLAHAVFHCFALIAFGCDLERYDSFDNRPRG